MIYIKMKKIFIVEDDVGISHSLKLYLENSDFKVVLHHTWEKAIERITQENPDLVILDINLPKKSGIEICKELRETSGLPIIMLTAKTSELDKIVGFEVGADDYIEKPFSPRELSARINSILRRSKETENSENPDLLIFKNIEIDTEKMIVKVSGEKVSMTKNEYDILKKIIEENGKVVSRETIMTEVIGYEKYIYDRTIDTHIKNLRKKIWGKDIIVTVRWEWYRLNN